MEERLDLTRFLKEEWIAGEQIDALKTYLTNKFNNFLWEYQENDYEGNCYVIFKIQFHNVYVLWRDYFGSCSGCDRLDGKNLLEGLEYIKDTLQEGNTKQFKSLEEMLKYLNTTEDYFWSTDKKLIIEAIEKLIKEEIE